MRRRRPDPDDPVIPTVPLRTAGLRLLSRRDYTAAELRQRLLDRGYIDTEIDALIVELRTSRWLDDARVASAHVRSAATIKGRGRYRIERELAARGLDKSTIRNVIADTLPEDETAAIDDVLKRKHVAGTLDQAARQRLFQHLLRRGFSAGAITRVLHARALAPDED